MKKRIIAYILILLGVLPILSKILISALYSGNQQMTVMLSRLGNGFIFSTYIIGAILMIIGFYMLKKEKFRSKSEEEEQNLNEGEKVVFKQVGGVSILTITNQRILFYGFYVDGMRKSITNLPPTNKVEYPIAEIVSVKPINSGDLADSKQLVSAKWGVQISMKNGKIINIPISEQDVVAQQIEKLILELN